LFACTVAAVVGWADAGNCFRPLRKPLELPPFHDAEVASLRQHLIDNLNYHGTGATVASPGDTPALSSLIGGPAAGYVFDWMRDSGLTISGLMKLSRTRVAEVGPKARLYPDTIEAINQNYLRWVKSVIAMDGDIAPGGGHVDAHGEGKWEISPPGPFKGGWCRPQSDGPPIRAAAILSMVNRSQSAEQRKELWELAKFDLDWLLDSTGANIQKDVCDLWEEETDSPLFWNRMMMRTALSMGYYVAYGMGDGWRAERCHQVLSHFIRNPVIDHRMVRHDRLEFLSECASSAAEDGNCRKKGKQIDGAVILALIHSGWTDFRQLKASSMAPADSPRSVLVANTVRAHIEHWCDAYEVNRHDSDRQTPGVLLGRFVNDGYGGQGGNPWVLITAALASLLYQGAQDARWKPAMTPEALTAWRAALNLPDFSGTTADFVAQGDAVMWRLHSHVVQRDGSLHLYEQIDQHTGLQYNAKDLTWSYTEVLAALAERELAIGGGDAEQWLPRRLQEAGSEAGGDGALHV